MSIVTAEELEKELIKEGEKITNSFKHAKRLSPNDISASAKILQSSDSNTVIEKQVEIIDTEDTYQEITTYVKKTKEPIIAKSTEDTVVPAYNINDDDLAEFDSWEDEVKQFKGWEDEPK